eukprot:2457304-Rhodomonas_salina.1
MVTTWVGIPTRYPGVPRYRVHRVPGTWYPGNPRVPRDNYGYTCTRVQGTLTMDWQASGFRNFENFGVGIPIRGTRVPGYRIPSFGGRHRVLVYLTGTEGYLMTHWVCA